MRSTNPGEIRRPTGLTSLPRLPIDSPGSRTPEASPMFHSGRLHFPDAPEDYHFTADDLIDIGEIGKGNFGTVNKMKHKATDRLLAVKRIRSCTVSNSEQMEMLVELKTVIMAQHCDYIVRFFGAIFYEGDCWICMELVDLSMDMLYKRMYERSRRFSEKFIWHLVVSTVRALVFLKEKLHMIHRDIKPSNILLNTMGSVKLCDFGIAGKLVDSIARTQDVGCKPYMAPERLSHMNLPYGVRSDVWSLGISLYEISTGRFPYREKEWKTAFEQLGAVVNGPAPVLTFEDTVGTDYSISMLQFVNQCLVKDRSTRPNYKTLMHLDFIRKYDGLTEEIKQEVGDLVTSLLPYPSKEELKEEVA